jgi:hypothetical protein
MPDLHFRVESAEAVRFAASPTIALSLRVRNATAEPIHAVGLRCQVRLEPAQRHYSPEEQELLRDLFGEPSRWARTVRGLLWTHVDVQVPSFEGETVVELPMPCTFDFEVAVTKYFHALSDGEAPLLLLFSGTVFYEDGDGLLRVAQISWQRETSYRLPVRLWRELMDQYYPNSAWLRLNRDTFDRLHRYKVAHGIPTWEQALDRLLSLAAAQA